MMRSDLTQHSVMRDRVRADEQFEAVQPRGQGGDLSRNRPIPVGGKSLLSPCGYRCYQEGSCTAGGIKQQDIRIEQCLRAEIPQRALGCRNHESHDGNRREEYAVPLLGLRVEYA